VYYHEIPGGQYSNLRPQVASMGLLDRWNAVKHAFAVVNSLLGDIPKVTPSSKMVGDLAIFLVQNELLILRDDFSKSVSATRERVLSEAPHLDFPQSCVQYFQGYLGQPPGGFPEDLRQAVLKGLPQLGAGSSAELEPLDLEELGRLLESQLGRVPVPHEIVSAALYPRVFGDYVDFRNRHGDVSILDTPVFFYGLEPGQEIWVELEAGKTLVISLNAVSDPHPNGTRTVFFTLNGQGRQVTVSDRSIADETENRRRADDDQPGEVGAPMPGTVIALHCQEGQRVQEGDPLLDLEAMKMETVVRSPRAGTVVDVVVNLQDGVQRGDLLIAVELD
jgi:pyruvate carboxylase